MALIWRSDIDQCELYVIQSMKKRLPSGQTSYIYKKQYVYLYKFFVQKGILGHFD